jgi:hypothetical protein
LVEVAECPGWSLGRFLLVRYHAKVGGLIDEWMGGGSPGLLSDWRVVIVAGVFQVAIGVHVGSGRNLERVRG